MLLSRCVCLSEAAAASNDMARAKQSTSSCRIRLQQQQHHQPATGGPSVSQLKRPRPPDRPRPMSMNIGEARSPISISPAGDGQGDGNCDGGKDHVTELQLVLERTTNDLRVTKNQLREKSLGVEALAVVLQQMSNKVLITLRYWRVVGTLALWHMCVWVPWLYC